MGPDRGEIAEILREGSCGALVGEQDVDGLVRGSIADFAKVYMNTTQEWSFEDLETINDVSIEQFVRERTDNRDVIDFFRYMGWLFGGSYFSCGEWETREARVQRERDQAQANFLARERARQGLPP